MRCAGNCRCERCRPPVSDGQRVELEPAPFFKVIDFGASWDDVTGPLWYDTPASATRNPMLDAFIVERR